MRLSAKYETDYVSDYLIVLGATIRDDGPGKLLRNRCGVAIDYINKNPDAAIVASGGYIKGKQVSEASVIKSYLVKKGVDEKSIILEEESLNTYNNLVNSLSVIKEKGITDKKVIVITSDFHSLRVGMIARKMGINSLVLSAKTPYHLIPFNYFREFFAVCKYLLLKY